MRFFKTLALSAVAAALTAAPAAARIESNTGELIEMMNNSGINVTINDPEHCSSREYLGVYVQSGMRRWMALCPGNEVDPIDHATVRHEAWHAVQHCVNVARGTDYGTPVQDDLDQLVELVNEYVPADEVTFIKANYTQDKWAIEFEAHVAEHGMTATDIIEIFSKVCLGE